MGLKSKSSTALAKRLERVNNAIMQACPGSSLTRLFTVLSDTALRLGRYFGNNPQFWMNLQSQYDLAVASNEYGETIKNEVRLSA